MKHQLLNQTATLETLEALKEAGYEITTDHVSYIVFNSDSKEVFRALPMNATRKMYLTSFNPQVLSK